MSEQKVNLKRIWISRDCHGNFKGDLEIDLNEGEIKIVLSQAEVNCILKQAAASIERIAGEAADRIRSAIMDALGGLDKQGERQ